MSDNACPIITVDGPSGSGKGTLGRMLAERLGYHFLDSGALYRLLALYALWKEIELTDGPAVAALAPRMRFGFKARADGSPGVQLDDRDVSFDIRSEACAAAASRIAALPEVRAALLQAQRDFAGAPGLVADGRDMGTVVFPQAALKLFLTASAEERARRRQNQLMEQGISASLDALLDDLARRDARDAARAVAPLAPAADAILLDSTGLDIATVLDLAFDLASRRIRTG